MLAELKTIHNIVKLYTSILLLLLLLLLSSPSSLLCIHLYHANVPYSSCICGRRGVFLIF